MSKSAAVRIGAAAAAAALVGVPAASLASPSAHESGVVRPQCSRATNIEAIIDDSASMGRNDRFGYRRTLMKILMAKRANRPKTLGAVEFGGQAADLFGPGVVGPNRTAYSALLNQRVTNHGALGTDGGKTNYNAAFAQAATHNARADARIFLTDGGHNEGTYAKGHQGGPKTFTIGFGRTASVPLRRIARDTGGRYFSVQDAEELQSVASDLDAELNCYLGPKTYVDSLLAGRSRVHTVNVKRGAKYVDFEVTWPTQRTDPGIRIAGFRLKSGKTSRRVSTKTTRGSTFITVRVGPLGEGQLKFTLGAESATQVTTKATQATR